jgi:hypothetical protein
MPLTPKATFLTKPGAANKHAEQVLSPEFQEAAMTALAQYAVNLSSAPDMGTAAAHHWKMQGAKEFLNTLLSLHEKTEPPKPRTDNALNHHV